MAQTYNKPINTSTVLGDGLSEAGTNDEALRSSFSSGTAFPTVPAPVAGQWCFRTDIGSNGTMHNYNGASWVIAPFGSVLGRQNSGKFDGEIAAITLAGNEHKHFLRASAASLWLLKGIDVFHAAKVGTPGTTTLRVSTAGVGGAGTNLDVSLTGAVTNAQATGSVAYTAAAAIFVFISAEGSDGSNFHHDIQYTLYLEPA